MAGTAGDGAHGGGRGAACRGRIALGWASLAVGWALQGILYGVDAFDPGALAAVAAFLGAVVLLASLLPARRAALVDPLTALRSE
jgi:hypothetical protein